MDNLSLACRYRRSPRTLTKRVLPYSMTALPRQRQNITEANILQSVSQIQLTPQHARATPTRF
jgi:hypothetical protein